MTDRSRVSWNSIASGAQGKYRTPGKKLKLYSFRSLEKKVNLENLRTISLTLCLGKVLERIALTRLIKHVEEHHLFSPTLFGFCQAVSTQDIIGCWRETSSTWGSKTIFGLDLQKAFHNFKHEAILKNLSDVNVGSWAHKYVTAFLKDSTATISIGGINSPKIKLGTRGTPQGVLLSLFLFNCTMNSLSEQLDQISLIHHSIYADNATLWSRKGHTEEVRHKLQKVADTVQAFAYGNDLKCSFTKSKLYVDS